MCFERNVLKRNVLTRNVSNLKSHLIKFGNTLRDQKHTLAYPMVTLG